MVETSVSPPRSKRRRLSMSGPTPTTYASGHVISLYSWNVNGIGPFLEPKITSYFRTQNGVHATAQTTKAHTCLRDVLRRHGWPTLLFLQEVKINVNDTATIRSLERAVKSDPSESAVEPDYIAKACLASHRAKGFGGKVYGVCSIIRKDFYDLHVVKVREVDWDVEGRILVIETAGDEQLPKLAIFNVYLVNGTDLPHKDPTTGELTGASRHDRKIRVHELLAAEFAALQAEGFAIVAAGDMNIARSPIDGFPNLRTFPRQHCFNRADFEARFFRHGAEGVTPESANDEQAKKDKDGTAGLGMIDTFRELHPSTKAYTYYPRNKPFGESCDRVDMIITSASLKRHLVTAGMHETTQERGPSDHVPLYAEFSFDQVSPRQER